MTDPLAGLRAALDRPARPSSDFDLNPGSVRDGGRTLKPAAVLIAVDLTADTPRIWLTKRSSALQHHPGQIAFPGGKVDAGDADAVAAALRESHEEIGLDPAAVEVLGTLPAHVTVTGYSVTPVLGAIRQSFDPKPEPGEVDEAFSVPLDHVLDIGRYSVQSRRWRGQRRHYYTVPFGPYYIWGATARMLRALAEMTDG